MEDDVIFMLNKFPTYRSEILKAYMNNEEFKSLCEDFCSAVKTFENLQRKMIKDYKGELEYRKVILDLEKEALEFLENKKNKK